VLVVSPMGKIETRHVHSGADECPQTFEGVARRAKRAN
jgi:hypothetical protein